MHRKENKTKKGDIVNIQHPSRPVNQATTAGNDQQFYRPPGSTNIVPENLRAQDAADYLGVSASTLAKLRMRENRARGPKFSRLGGVIIYRRSDLDEWVSENAVPN